MVLDTSAIIATIANEQDSARFRTAMLGAENLLISSVAVLETKIVLFARLGLDAVGLFEELLENAGIVVHAASPARPSAARSRISAAICRSSRRLAAKSRRCG